MIDAGPGQAVGAARGLCVVWGEGRVCPGIDSMPACVAVSAVGEAAAGCGGSSQLVLLM